MITIPEKDSLFEDAAMLVVDKQRADVLLFSKVMKMGYMRSIRLMDQLEMAGVIKSSKNQSESHRKVLISTREELFDVLLKNVENIDRDLIN